MLLIHTVIQDFLCFAEHFIRLLSLLQQGIKNLIAPFFLFFSTKQFHILSSILCVCVIFVNCSNYDTKLLMWNIFWKLNGICTSNSLLASLASPDLTMKRQVLVNISNAFIRFHYKHIWQWISRSVSGT